MDQVHWGTPWTRGQQNVPTLFKVLAKFLVDIIAVLGHFLGQDRSKMAYKGQKVQKAMAQPINLIFRYLQNRSRIQIWQKPERKRGQNAENPVLRSFFALCSTEMLAMQATQGINRHVL